MDEFEELRAKRKAESCHKKIASNNSWREAKIKEWRSTFNEPDRSYLHGYVDRLIGQYQRMDFRDSMMAYDMGWLDAEGDILLMVEEGKL